MHAREMAKRTRGHVILCKSPPDTTGHEIKGKPHYWIVVSRNDINWNTDLLIVAVPIVTHRDDTHRDVTDIAVKKKKSPTGENILIRCGQIRALDSNRVLEWKKLCSTKLMKEIDDKLKEILEFDDILNSIT